MQRSELRAASLRNNPRGTIREGVRFVIRSDFDNLNYYTSHILFITG
jgi:hypothetical protein